MMPLPDDFKDEVLRQFGALREDIQHLDKKIENFKKEYDKQIMELTVAMAVIKVKLGLMAGIYGTLGGLGAALIVVVLATKGKG